MLLSDIQYGRLQLIELSISHTDQSGNQRQVATYYTHCQQCYETLKGIEYSGHNIMKTEANNELILNEMKPTLTNTQEWQF